MKTLILATDIYTRGGIARYTSTLAAALGGIIGRENIDVMALLNTGRCGEETDGLRVLGALSDRPTLRAKADYAAESLRAARAQYDLVVCSHAALAPVAAIIRSLFHTPFWVACHDSEVWERNSLPRRGALQRAQFALPVSRFTGEKLSAANSIPREKIRVLYNAVPDRFAAMLMNAEEETAAPAQRTGGRRYVLSVGSLARVHAYKGFDTVIRVLPRLAAEAGDLHYVIVGKGDDRARLEALALRVGVCNRITFAGSVGCRELAALYRGCAAFVMPSRASAGNGQYFGEGFGRVYVEAAMAARPVVGSGQGGAAEAVLHRKTGLLVNPESEAEVADALSLLLRNKDLAEQMGREGREWAGRNFSEATLRSQLAGLLREGGYLQ